MSAKTIPALVIALLLGTTALASAQTLVLPSYGYTYGYAYVPAYPPAVPYVAPQYAITPRYYAPAITGTRRPTAAGAARGGIGSSTVSDQWQPRRQPRLPSYLKSSCIKYSPEN